MQVIILFELKNYNEKERCAAMNYMSLKEVSENKITTESSLPNDLRFIFDIS